MLPKVLPRDLKPNGAVHPCCGVHEQCVLACHVAMPRDALHLAVSYCADGPMSRLAPHPRL